MSDRHDQVHSPPALTGIITSKQLAIQDYSLGPMSRPRSQFGLELLVFVELGGS